MPLTEKESRASIHAKNDLHSTFHSRWKHVLQKYIDICFSTFHRIVVSKISYKSVDSMKIRMFVHQGWRLLEFHWCLIFRLLLLSSTSTKCHGFTILHRWKHPIFLPFFFKTMLHSLKLRNFKDFRRNQYCRGKYCKTSLPIHFHACLVYKK